MDKLHILCSSAQLIVAIDIKQKNLLNKHNYNINPIKNGELSLCTNFSHVTSTNEGISPENFLTFSFNLFATLAEIFETTSSASPKLLNCNQDHPSKKVFFWSNPYKMEVMITSLIEVLQLLNFDPIPTSTI